MNMHKIFKLFLTSILFSSVSLNAIVFLGPDENSFARESIESAIQNKDVSRLETLRDWVPEEVIISHLEEREQDKGFRARIYMLLLRRRVIDTDIELQEENRKQLKKDKKSLEEQKKRLRELKIELLNKPKNTTRKSKLEKQKKKLKRELEEFKKKHPLEPVTLEEIRNRQREMYFPVNYYRLCRGGGIRYI